MVANTVPPLSRPLNMHDGADGLIRCMAELDMQCIRNRLKSLCIDSHVELMRDNCSHGYRFLVRVLFHSQEDLNYFRMITDDQDYRYAVLEVMKPGWWFGRD